MAPWKFETTSQKQPMKSTAAGASSLAAMNHTHKTIVTTAQKQTARNKALAGGRRRRTRKRRSRRRRRRRGRRGGGSRGTQIVPQAPHGSGNVTAYGPGHANQNITNSVKRGNSATSDTQYDGAVAPIGTPHSSSANPTQGGGGAPSPAYYSVCGPSCPYDRATPLGAPLAPPQFRAGGGRRRRRKRTRRRRRRRRRKRRRFAAKRRRKRGRRRGMRGGNTACKLYDVRTLIQPSYPIYRY